MFKFEESSCAQYFFIFAAVLGTLRILSCVYRLLNFFHRHFFRSDQDLMAKYGNKDSWVVVTGGSDGIGLDICKKMARLGFNVCIMGRNAQKIKDKFEEIEACSPPNKKVKTLAVIADFGEISRIQDYKELAAKLVDIDIAMLYLNAGILEVGYMEQLADWEVEQQVMINALQPIYLCKALLSQQLNREKRSAIIVTSSSAALYPFSGMATYSSTKAFVTNLANALQYELKDKIDVVSYNPGFVSTKLIPEKAQKRMGNMMSTDMSVTPMLRDLGRDKIHIGAARQEFTTSMFLCNPSWFLPNAAKQWKKAKEIKDKMKAEKKE